MLVPSILIAIFLYRSEGIHTFLLNLSDWGYVGAFIGGLLFVSTFTAATGAIILLVLAERLSAVEIGIIAGLGAVIGDLTIFKFVKDGLASEIKHIYNKFDRQQHVAKLLHTRYFGWTFPFFGALVIASPLPDEIGVSLMGISKMSTPKFLILSFILNCAGIFLVISASSFIKP